MRVSVWGIRQLAVVQASNWGDAMPRAGWDTLTEAATGALGACECGGQSLVRWLLVPASAVACSFHPLFRAWPTW